MFLPTGLRIKLQELSFYRWEEVNGAWLAVAFGIALLVPGELQPRANAFPLLVEYFSRWIWGGMLVAPPLLIILWPRMPLAVKMALHGLQAVVWMLMVITFGLTNMKLLGILLYARNALTSLGLTLFVYRVRLPVIIYQTERPENQDHA